MSGFRDSYNSIKKYPEVKNEIEVKKEEAIKDEEEKSPPKKDSLFQLMQVQISICLIFFLLLIGIKTINSTFYSSVRAGTFEKSYRLTNLWDINTKLDSIAQKSRLLSFVLGRQQDKKTPAKADGKKDVTASSDVGGSEIAEDVFNNEDASPVFGTSVSSGTLNSFNSPKIIPTLDEAITDTAEEIDDSKEEKEPEKKAGEQTVKIPEYDKEHHKISATYYNPVKSYITCNFGIRSDPFTKKQGFHTGVDIGIKKGTKVICPMKGTVSKTGRSSVWGYYIMVNHGNGFETFYAHLSSIKVKKGASVKAKELLALSGSTGRSTGPHLHFEVHFGGKYQDPLLYFDFK